MSWALYVAIAGAALLWLAYNPIGWWRLRRVPSPPRVPFLGHLVSIQAKTLHGFHFESFRLCGPIFTLWWGRRPFVVVCDPMTCRKVMQRCPFRIPPPAPFLAGPDLDFYTEGLVFAKDMGHHKALRSAWAPHFTPASLAAYHPLMTQAIRRLVAHLRPAAQSCQPLDIHNYVSCMTLEATGRAAFGIDINSYPPSITATKEAAAKGAAATPLISADATVVGGNGDPAGHGAAAGERSALGREVVDSMEMVIRSLRPSNASAWGALYVLLPEVAGQAVAAVAKLFPDASWRQLLKAQDNLRDVAHKLIRDSRTGGGGAGGTTTAPPEQRGRGLDPGSFLTHLMATPDKASGGATPMTEAALVGNIMAFIAAGYETSANTLAFALHQIAANPEVETKLLQEVDAFGPAGTVPSLEDLVKFPYVAAIIDETMRLMPVVSYIFRQADEPITLHGHDLPAGTTFQVSVWAAHHDPDVWREAETFKPDRFLPGHSEWSAPDGAFMPFGGGLRTCIGSRFALQELKLALVALFQHYTFRLAPGFPALRLMTGITTGPEDPIMVTAHARHTPHT